MHLTTRHLWQIPLLTLVVLVAAAGSTLANDPFASLAITRTPGVQTPTFELPTLGNGTIKPTDLPSRVVLLNFWATWCGPCKEEMPALERLRQAFQEEDLVILAITADVRPGAIKAFWRKLDLGFPVLLDSDQEVSRSFMVRGLPTTILIRPDGTVIGRAVGPRAWDSPAAMTLIRQLIEPS